MQGSSGSSRCRRRRSRWASSRGARGRIPHARPLKGRPQWGRAARVQLKARNRRRWHRPWWRAGRGRRARVRTRRRSDWGRFQEYLLSGQSWRRSWQRTGQILDMPQLYLVQSCSGVTFRATAVPRWRGQGRRQPRGRDGANQRGTGRKSGDCWASWRAGGSGVGARCSGRSALNSRIARRLSRTA